MSWALFFFFPLFDLLARAYVYYTIMKFGKEYERSLNNPLFSEQLRRNAIAYRKVCVYV